MIFLPEEARDPYDGGGADPGRLVNFTISKRARVEQFGDMPAFGQAVEFGRGTQVGEECPGRNLAVELDHGSGELVDQRRPRF